MDWGCDTTGDPAAVRLEAFRRYARVAGALIAAVGAVVFVGWIFHVAALKYLVPGMASMKVNTSIGCFFGGLSLSLLVAEPVPARRLFWSRAAAAVLVFIGAATCAQYLFRIDLGIDQLVLADPDPQLSLRAPGRMSPVTAITFLCLGGALLLVDRPRAQGVVQILCVTAVLLPGLVILGYLYHVPTLSSVWTYVSVALHTAISFCILSTGILCARPDRGLVSFLTGDTAGGLMARRLLPAALLFPPAVGWLRLMGERAGYYDGLFGLAIFAGSNVVVFTTLVFLNARSLARLDATRRAQEAHLRQVVEHSPAGVAMLDRDMRYVLVSPGWLKDYGLQGRDVIGRCHYDLFPDLPERWKELHRRCLAGEASRNDEDPFPRADGTIDWVRWEIRPWRDPQGRIGGILMFAELVSDRKRAEERFHATFEQAAVGIAHVDPDGGVLRANQKLCDILGYAREELVQRNLHDLTHPDDRGADGDLATESRDQRVYRKDGGVVWVHETRSVVRLPSGAPDYVLSVVEDITRRKEAEEALRAAQARLSSLSEANLIGIVVSDLAGRFQDANAAFLSMIGYTREELLSGAFTGGTLTPPEYAAAREQSLKDLATRGVLTPREREFLRKDGSRVAALVGGSRIKGTEDQAVYFVLDLSERRLLEEQLRQSQRMEVIGRLAGGVAHDFNNLLTPILGYADLLLMKAAEGDPSREDLHEIRRSAERAAALTRQLLAFSRKQMLQPKVLDLNVLIGDAARLLRRLIGEDVTLTLSMSPSMGRVKVDPGQIEQVLMNLAVNARDAMPGGGRLTIETSMTTLDADYGRGRDDVEPGRYAMISVSDTGTGMTKEVQARLFEPFFTTKEQGKGTGLGLATVHGIVKQSRGHIFVYSEPGRGTTFKVYFPEVDAAETPPSGERPAVAPADRGSETLLLVEDDETLRAFAARVLRSKGYTVLEARSGEHALQVSKAHAGTVDLMLTDVVMPGMSGREAARQVLASRPRVKVLYMSGYTEDAIVHHGVLDEGTELLEKPFTPESLTKRVRSVLSR